MRKETFNVKSMNIVGRQDRMTGLTDDVVVPTFFEKKIFIKNREFYEIRLLGR